MLKSYEAIYKNGILRWLDQNPALPDKELHVLVIVEMTEANTDSTLKEPVEKWDAELDDKLQKWLNGNQKKPRGGRLRPIIQGKTVAQRVLEDRGE